MMVIKKASTSGYPSINEKPKTPVSSIKMKKKIAL
jgi:hypothetical protein